MRVIERRIDVELHSRATLLALMGAKGGLGRPISYAALADAATAQMRLAGIKDRKVSKSTIGHLASGYIKRTHPDTAKAIALALGVPEAALFVTKVSSVTRDVSPAA